MLWEKLQPSIKLRYNIVSSRYPKESICVQDNNLLISSQLKYSIWKSVHFGKGHKNIDMLKANGIVEDKSYSKTNTFYQSKRWQSERLLIAFFQTECGQGWISGHYFNSKEQQWEGNKHQVWEQAYKVWSKQDLLWTNYEKWVLLALWVSN